MEHIHKKKAEKTRSKMLADQVRDTAVYLRLLTFKCAGGREA